MSAPAPAIPATPTKQTGPRTAEGKDRSSTNATLHGGTSNKLIIPGEDPAAFDALLAGLLADYCPDSVESRLLIENAALAHWFLLRRQRAFAAIEAAVYENEPDQAKWSDEHLKRLALADRYKTQAERALKRALANVEIWRKARYGEAENDRRHAQREAELDLKERRIALHQKKLEWMQSRQAARAFRFAKTALSSPEAPVGTNSPSRPRAFRR